MRRRVQLDQSLLVRTFIAIFLFALFIGGTVVWAIGGGDKSPAYPTVLNVAVIVGLAIADFILVPVIYYRCPTCKRKLPRASAPKSEVHYYCAACNIEWDLGLRPGRY
ncbi:MULTISPECIES: hypothetical protein [Trichocoleus]|uniref:Uncharacterized protein n=1 Tax=Trichocoleus desertorum GB2-A4 TaxID=2933944 RepID=A0ABV0JBS9_9CYAN|nr:hypothetical protein [Trichocoleus sp. FACHB-46]MBD1860885.1 hypothetical protein [Trichocoleus sp. FACHB-46]